MKSPWPLKIETRPASLPLLGGPPARWIDTTRNPWDGLGGLGATSVMTIGPAWWEPPQPATRATASRAGT